MYSEEEIQNFVENQNYIYLKTEFREKERWILVKCECNHEEYWVRWGNFKKGRRCKQCHYEKNREKKEKRNVEVKKYVNSRGYELLEILYINDSKYVRIKCKKGHEWVVRYDTFKRREQECRACKEEEEIIKSEFKVKEYVEKYGYELLESHNEIDERTNKSRKFILLKCPNKHEWKTRFDSFKDGCRCPYCGVSKGERVIMNWLDKNNIKYIYNESYFKDLLSPLNNPLKPDFILPDYKIWIEYDGEFHYDKYYDSQNFEMLQIHDEIKNQYAIKNNWKLIRVPYWDFDKIEEILDKEIF